MKLIFALLTVLLLGLIVYGRTQPADEPMVTIEGHQVPYRLVRVWNKHAPRRRAVIAYYDPESQIDFVEEVPVAKAKEILAFQASLTRFSSDPGRGTNRPAGAPPQNERLSDPE